MNFPFCCYVEYNKKIKKNVSFVLPRARLFSSMEGMDPIKIIIVYWCIEKISQKLIKNKSFGICFSFCVLISFFFSHLNSLRNEFYLCMSMLWILLFGSIFRDGDCGSWFFLWFYLLDVVVFFCFFFFGFFSDEEKTNI